MCYIHFSKFRRFKKKITIMIGTISKSYIILVDLDLEAIEYCSYLNQ